MEFFLGFAAGFAVAFVIQRARAKRKGAGLDSRFPPDAKPKFPPDAKH